MVPRSQTTTPSPLTISAREIVEGSPDVLEIAELLNGPSSISQSPFHQDSLLHSSNLLNVFPQTSLSHSTLSYSPHCQSFRHSQSQSPPSKVSPAHLTVKLSDKTKENKPLTPLSSSPSHLTPNHTHRFISVRVPVNKLREISSPSLPTSNNFLPTTKDLTHHQQQQHSNLSKLSQGTLQTLQERTTCSGMSDNGVIVETPAATDMLPDKYNQPGQIIKMLSQNKPNNQNNEHTTNNEQHFKITSPFLASKSMGKGKEDLSHADTNVDACCSWSQYGQIPDKKSLMSTSHFDYKHKRPEIQQIWMRDEKSQDIEDVLNISTPPNTSYPKNLMHTEHKGKPFTKSGIEASLHQSDITVQKRLDQSEIEVDQRSLKNKSKKDITSEYTSCQSEDTPPYPELRSFRVHNIMNENGQSNDSQEGIPKSAIERGITLEIMEHDDDNIIQTLSEGQALLSKGYRLHQNIGLDHSGMEFNSYLTDEERIRNRVSELLTTSLASSPTNSSEENHKATRKETKRREYKSKQTDQSLKRNPQKDQLQKKNSKKLKSGSSGAALPGITLSQEIINLPNQLYKQGLQQYVYLVSGHCYDRQTEGTTISSVDNFHIPLGHTQISTNNLLSRMNFCSSGGVTLVESEIDVIEEEREGREMEARMSESLQNEKTTQAVDKEDQIRKMEREKKLDGTLQLDTSKQDTKLKPVDMATFKQCINGLSSLKIVYLPSINIESSNVVTMATSPMSSTEDKDDKIESISDSSLSLSSQPCIMLKGQPSPPPQEESVPTSLLQPSCFTPYENKPVSSFEMENRVQQRYQEQAQKWVQQELMTHLIASLDNNDNPITTSPTASSSCNTTDTEDVTVTELVRNILLQETLTLLLQKEEKSEFKKEYDGEDEGHYDFSSFETDVSSTTPLSTPHPTPPQSPVPMEQAPPTEPVLITPVSSLSNILENITDKDDNISTPEPSSSILTDNTSPHPLISSCKDTTELDDTITTPIATPSHSAVVSTPDITSHKEPSIQLKKAPLESSTSDSTHSTSTTHLPVALSISESTTTDEELSLGQCLHDNKLQRLVKQRGDISSSEGEVPMSPGDVHWNILLQTKQDVVSKATVQVPMMTNFDLKDMSSDSSEKSWSQGHSLGEARIKQSKRVPNDGGGVFDKYLFKLTTSTPESDTSTTKHNNEDEDTDNTLAGIPSLTELDDDNKFHTIEHRSLSPGEVRRPLIKGSRRTENPLSDGEVPLELKMYRKSRNKRDIVVKDTTPRSISTENELRDGIDVINISRGKGVPQLSHTQIASPVINETIRVQVVHSISQDNQVTSSSSSPKLTISETPLQSPQQIKPHPYTITIAHAPPNDSSPGKTAQSLMQGPVKVIEESSQGTEPSCSSFSSISVPLPD